MRVILLRDVPGLGRAGDLKVVADGYGRNYLIAQGFAVLATPQEIRKWEEKQKKAKLEAQKQYDEALELKNKIESLEMKKTLKKSEKGGVFDSLRKEDIIEFLKSNNIEIPKSSIDLPQPIKKDGQYSVPIYLLAAGKEHPALIATLRVTLLLSPEP